MNSRARLAAAVFVLAVLPRLSSPAMAADITANPSNYRTVLRSLKPGDSMVLSPGEYKPLYLSDLNGTPEAWITIKGPAVGAPAIIVGESGSNTVEIVNSSYLAIENLRIDSQGIPGAFGISAKGRNLNRTHDVRIEGNSLVGQNGNQQTDGISTKIPTWGWTIRRNQIIGAGTGIYLGDSDGTQPFVNGLIENNLVAYSIGYNLEIKDQISLPTITGMPLLSTSTIIRNNVFIKDDKPSPDGDRPNVLVGAFPGSGLGSNNLYEIYGNFFFHNPREALFQGSGRLSLHDNIFVDGPVGYSAIVLRKQNFPLKLAFVYNNTIYTSGRGIYFGTLAVSQDAVMGNLIFASDAIAGPIGRLSNNLVASVASAAQYVSSPSFDLGAMNFYPRAGKCKGPPIDLTLFHTDTDYNLDFNGHSKGQATRGGVFRGAYAGAGLNPGWRLQAGIKSSTVHPSESRLSRPPVNDRPETRSLDVRSATGTYKTISSLSLKDYRLGSTSGGCCAWTADAYAPGLLLWRSATGAEPASAQRCDCSTVARASE